jgi:hypothetical protein
MVTVHAQSEAHDALLARLPVNASAEPQGLSLYMSKSARVLPPEGGLSLIVQRCGASCQYKEHPRHERK